MGVFWFFTVVVALCGAVTISNTEPRITTDGAAMDAHDGNIVQWEAGGLFYWYGMGYGDCTETKGALPPRDCPGIYRKFGTGCGFLLDHKVNVFSSKDLVDWKFEGEALPEHARPTGVYFRPKVIYNAATSEFVLWINYLPDARTALGSYPNATFLVATSSSPTGPFSVVTQRAAIEHEGGGDFTLLVTDDGKSGYLAYDSWSTSHRVAVEQLTDDFRDSRGAEASSGLLSPTKNEAPMLFSRRGWYYLLYGHTCCFCRNGANSRVLVAPSPLGPWNDTTSDLNAATGFDLFGKKHPIPAQANYVFKVADPEEDDDAATTYVYTGDLWESASDKLKSHDRQYWEPLKFDDTVDPPTIAPLNWVDSFDLDLP